MSYKKPDQMYKLKPIGVDLCINDVISSGISAKAVASNPHLLQNDQCNCCAQKKQLEKIVTEQGEQIRVMQKELDRLRVKEITYNIEQGYAEAFYDNKIQKEFHSNECKAGALQRSKKTAENFKEIQKFINELHLKKPNLSFSDLCKRAEKHFKATIDYSHNTIRKKAKNPTTQKGDPQPL